MGVPLVGDCALGDDKLERAGAHARTRDIRAAGGAAAYRGQVVRRATILALLAAAAWAATGCVERSADDLDPSSASTSSMAPTASTTTTAAVPATTLVFEERIEAVREVAELTPILSPTGNIYCQVDPGTFAECGVLEQDWEPPPQPADCPLDWGETISVGIGGSPADFVCAGDSSYGGPESERLPYGHAVRADGLICLSEESGMTCWAEESRRGFTVSRTDYRLF
jgi:hypothetical protein